MRNPALSFPQHPKYLTVGNLFSLAISQKTNSTSIIMHLLHDQVNTSNMPFIVDLLQQHLPTVLITECYNEENLPFAIEVRHTEIGHLFEHILLEYLCQLKLAKGSIEATYSGRTRWNWVRDPRGVFHIHLTCGQTDADILPTALEKAITLMELILTTKQTTFFPVHRYFYSRNGLKNGKRKKLKAQS